MLKLGLTPRAAEALLWLAQGKTNSDIAAILSITESTVKKYIQEMFDKLGVETRGAAAGRALEALNSPHSRRISESLCRDRLKTALPLSPTSSRSQRLADPV